MKTVLTIKWIILVLFLAGCSSTGSSKMAADPNASGTIMIDETQVMVMVGGSYGKGSVNVNGQTYPFKIDGLKLGGVGVHKLHITGNVYNLKNVADIEGTYFSAEAALTVVKGAGGFWMKNTRGVSLHLKVSGEGAALGLGMEGVEIKLLN
ncbi:MAG: DUF1134 domain-containing protein [Gammaproteobacteria bacterium]